MYNEKFDVHATVSDMSLAQVHLSAQKMIKLGFRPSFAQIDIPEDIRKKNTPASVYYDGSSINELAAKMKSFTV